MLNKVNGKAYVGSAVHLNKRKQQHFRALQTGRHKNTRLQRAWNKHGAEAFIFEVLETVENKSLLVAHEQHWIDFYFLLMPGVYNNSLTAGSPLGVRHTAKTRAKMSLVLIGNQRSKGCKQSVETKSKRSIALMGRVSPMKGRKHSAKTLAKLSAMRKGRKHSAETKAKISMSHKGMKASAETRARISVGHMGQIPRNKGTRGYKHSTEVRTKMSTAHKLQWERQRLLA